jgi:hypothetical protein
MGGDARFLRLFFVRDAVMPALRRKILRLFFCEGCRNAGLETQDFASLQDWFFLNSYCVKGGLLEHFLDGAPCLTLPRGDLTLSR